MPTAVHYRERLIPGVPAWIIVTAMAAVFGIAFGAALGTVVGWFTFVALIGLAIALIVGTAPSIEVTDDELRVGRARMPRRHIAFVEALDADAARDARGPHADARQYLVLRATTAATAVRIVLDDPEDPHPNWLVTTRHPQEFATALQ